MDVGRAVSAALDPVLVPAGFLPGQHGDNSDHVTFCAAHDDLSDRYPSLPQANSHERGKRRCIDLLIDQDQDGPLRLVLEDRSLADTLRALGRDGDAESVERTLTAPIPTALPVLADVLSRLFPSSAA
jgi:hypothetical protein